MCLKMCYKKYVFWSAIAMFCAGCVNYKNTPSQELIAKAQLKVQNQRYTEAADLLFIVGNRSPDSAVGKDAMRDACWLSLHQISHFFIKQPVFIQSKVLQIVAACNLVIALDKKYAIQNNLHVCKILAQCLLIRPYPDFDGQMLKALTDEVIQDNMSTIQKVMKSCEDYMNDAIHVGIDNEECNKEEMLVMKVYNFLQEMQNSLKYLTALVKKELSQAAPTLSIIGQLDNIIERYNNTAQMIVIVMLSMLLKIEILAEINIDIEYLEMMYTEMESYYNAIANKNIMNTSQKEKCCDILERARNVMLFIKENNHQQQNISIQNTNIVCDADIKSCDHDDQPA